MRLHLQSKRQSKILDFYDKVMKSFAYRTDNTKKAGTLSSSIEWGVSDDLSVAILMARQLF